MRIGSKTRSLTAALAGAFLCFAGASARAAIVPLPRSAHSATLLAGGDVLIAGGSSYLVVGGVTNTAEIKRTGNGGLYFAATPMNVARASHTATFMANGKVLIAGGWDGASIRCDAEVYDPIANAWTQVPAGGSAACGAGTMSSSRYNHTATLLNDGRVLICGGQDTFVSVTATCDFFTPTGLNGCAAAGGCLSPAPSLQLARAIHTAVLLKDGKVWIAGGWNPGLAVPPGYGKFTNTTERFDPVANAWNSANPLNEARAYHTATMMGDGKVLIAGGFNGRNDSTTGGNLGILQTAEIFDPIGNTTTQAGPLSGRREMAAAALNASGQVMIFGGLGNVPAAYVLNPSWPFVSGTLADTFSGGVGTIDPLASNAVVAANFNLGTNVSGIISSGTITYGDPIQIKFQSGTATLQSNSLFSNLSGVPVRNGQVSANLALRNMNGTVTFNSLASVSITITGNPGGGSLSFAPAPLTSANSPATLQPPSSLTNMTLTVGFPPSLAGATIVAGTITINSGGLTETSSYTVSFTGGNIYIPAGTTIGGNGVTGFTGNAVNLAGKIVWAAADPTYQRTSPATIPEPFSGSLNTSFNGQLDFAASGIPLASVLFPAQFTTSVASVTIGYMAFSDAEFYSPQANQMSPGFSPVPYSNAITQITQFGQTATLLPNNDVLLEGGFGCSSTFGSCPSFVTASDAGAGNARGRIIFLDTPHNFGTSNIFGNMTSPRAFHTSTLLPDGTILVAGGTNGPNILTTAEIFNPKTGLFAPTSQTMRDSRDLHTATLLPDGRVLIAGGFTTSAVSTGSTSGAEIYYPDTKIFIPTSSMTFARSNHTATLMPDGTVIAAGGFGVNDVITNSVEIYYSTSMTWGPLPNMPVTGRTLHTATLLKDGRLMLAGGQGPTGPLSSVVAYDPKTNGWASLAPMLSAVYAHTATLLFDGRVLVTGGNDGFGEANVSMTYDPNTDSWSNTGGLLPLSYPRFNHSALLLPNDEVMISGGQQRFGVVLGNAEFFHVNASSWTSGVSPDLFSQGPRAFHTMTLAPDGRVYAIGGSNGAIGGTGSQLYSAAEAAYFTSDPDSLSKGAPPSLRKSTITATSPSPFKENTPLSVWGLQFRGGTEAAGGGAASGNSSFSFPHLILQQIDGSGGSASQSNSGFVVDLTTAIYLNPNNLATLNSSITVQLPLTNAGLPYGWYNARIGANDIYSDGFYVQAGPAKPALAPSVATGTVLGTSSITWTWAAAADPSIVGYDVYQASSAVFLGTAPASTPFFIQTGLSANATASIIVAGYDLSGDGPLSFSATSYTLSLTPSPVFIASVTFNSLLLEWGANGNAQGTIYEVGLSTDVFATSFSTPVPSIAGQTATQVAIGQLQPNTTYSLRVRSYNGANQPSNYSVIVTTLTRAPVSSLVGTAISSQAIQWNWLDPGGVTFFKIYDSHTGAQVSTTSVAIFNDVNLPINSLRSINVSAVTGAGEGPLSGGATTFTLAAAPIPNSPPVVGMTTGSFTASWNVNNNPNITQYALSIFDYAVSSAGVLTAAVNTVTTAGNNAAISGLVPGTYVLVQISAINGQGVATLPVTLASTWTFVQQPNNLQILGTTPASVTLQWGQQSNSTSTIYQMTYSTDNFTTSITTAIPFSAKFAGSSTTLAGLVTSQQYWFRVQASNPFGELSVLSAAISTITTNGGAALGSLQGTLTAAGNSEITGSLGNGRLIDIRSPNGAFPVNVVLAVSSFDAAATPLCPNGLNVAFDFEESPALQPIRPIFVTFSYTLAELGAIPPSQLVLMRFEPTSKTCIPLNTTVNSAGQLVTAQINHFSLYQLAAAAPPSDMSQARIFPNPFRAAHDAYVTIDQVPAGARVRAMTLLGETVFDQTANANGLLTWSATNGAGRPLASGLYLIVLESGGVKKMLKLVVVR